MAIIQLSLDGIPMAATSPVGEKRMRKIQPIVIHRRESEGLFAWIICKQCSHRQLIRVARWHNGESIEIDVEED